MRVYDPDVPDLPEHLAGARECLDDLVDASTEAAAVLSGGEDRVADDDLFTFHFDQDSGHAQIAGHGFVLALTILQRLQTCRPPAAVVQPLTVMITE